jgi:peptidyl-prolyl cis-trans isomerase D
MSKFKTHFKSNPEQAQFCDREKDALNANFNSQHNDKRSVYTTDSEGKMKYEMESNKVNFAYAAGLYSTIKDSD